jgi:hypothetical protein
MDTSLLGLQPDIYQTMAAAAFQDPTKMSPTMLQFQQPQNMAGRATPLLQSQILQQMQPQFQQHPYLQNINGTTIQGQAQSEFLQQQLQRCQSFNEQKPQIQQQQEQQQQSQCMQVSQHQDMQQQKNMANYQSAFSQLSAAPQSSPTTLQAVLPFSQPQNFSDTNISSLSPSGASAMHNALGPFSSAEAASNHLSMPRPTAVPVPDPWSSKRVAVEPLLPSRPQGTPHAEQLNSAPPSISQSSALAPLPGRGCLVDQDENSDPQNHLLFGVSIDSHSLLMQGGLHDENDSTAIPYSTSNFLSPSQNDFSLDQTLNSPGCLDESGYVTCSQNADQANQPPATFVKVRDFLYTTSVHLSIISPGSSYMDFLLLA